MDISRQIRRAQELLDEGMHDGALRFHRGHPPGVRGFGQRDGFSGVSPAVPEKGVTIPEPYHLHSRPDRESRNHGVTFFHCGYTSHIMIFYGLINCLKSATIRMKNMTMILYDKAGKEK